MRTLRNTLSDHGVGHNISRIKLHCLTIVAALRIIFRFLKCDLPMPGTHIKKPGKAPGLMIVHDIHAAGYSKKGLLQHTCSAAFTTFTGRFSIATLEFFITGRAIITLSQFLHQSLLFHRTAGGPLLDIGTCHIVTSIRFNRWTASGADCRGAVTGWRRSDC